MAKPSILTSLMAAAASTVRLPPVPVAPAPAPTEPAVAEPGPAPSAPLPAAPIVAPVGVPVRNREKAPSVRRQEGRGVRTLSLCLFNSQREKLQELTTFLFEHDLRRSASLTVRTCFQVAKIGPGILPIAQAVADGTDYEKRNIAVYKDEQVILKNMTRYLVRNGLNVAEAVCGRVVIEMAVANAHFLEVARDLEERQDQRGKGVRSQAPSLTNKL